MSRISIDIADDLLLALREQPQDVVQEMRVSAALHYFQTRRLSLGQAARLTGIPHLAFLDVLMAHGIPAFDLSVGSVLKVEMVMLTPHVQRQRE
jgi:predicted HTH domain antitoxin